MASITFPRGAFSIFKVISPAFCANALVMAQTARITANEKRFNVCVKRNLFIDYVFDY